RRRHTRSYGDWSSDVCSSDLAHGSVMSCLCPSDTRSVDVIVLKYDPATERVSLGHKQLITDPWANVMERYPVGARVTGKVVSLKIGRASCRERGEVREVGGGV